MVTRIVVLLSFIVLSGDAVAGEWFEGKGDNPQSAMEEAIIKAKKESKGGCLCKNESPSIIKDCHADGIGGFICKACGSSHKGSCEKKKKKFGIF